MFRSTAAGLAAALVFAAGSAHSAVVLTGTGVYTNDFNSLAITGTTNTQGTLGGFEFSETGGGARDNELYGADTGGSNTGDTYSYGTAGSSERALGGLQSGSLIPLIGLQLVNDTGREIIAFTVTYTGEQWRLGTAGRADRLDVAYRIGDMQSALNLGNFFDVNALDFSSPTTTGNAGARDGNAAANRTAINGTVDSLSILQGQVLTLRWSDFNASGGDDGLAIDDFTFTPTFAAAAIPEPATWAMMIGGFGLVGGALRRRATVAARA